MVINVNFLELPCRIKAVSLKNDDDSYTVILNSKLSAEQQKDSFQHELDHIENDDFCTDSDVDEIEHLAHKYG
ncbi:MAG: hypothetical protein AB7E31_04440 [Desulfitobacterium sp.]